MYVCTKIISGIPNCVIQEKYTHKYIDFIHFIKESEVL